MARSLHLLLPLLASLAAGLASAAEGELPPLPALTEPASDLRIPGKFVWADLFTNEFEAARAFYTESFGWEWRWVSQNPEHRYGMFYSDDEAVAGLVFREPSEKGATYARWVHYLSVENVSRAIEGAVSRGGRVLLERRRIADRGDFAVVTDAEGAPFGVLRSSSGDPPDYRAAIGQWLWMALFSRNADTAAEFYTSLFGYEVREPVVVEEVVELILASDGYARAGIGQLSEKSDARPSWLGFVRVADLEATLASVRKAGGTVLYAPERVDEAGRLAIVVDPFGGTVGIMTWDFGAADAGEASP